MCEGHTHAIGAAVAGTAIVEAVFHPSPLVILGTAVVLAGTGLASDLDHHDSTMVGSFGPVTWLLHKIISRASGGAPRRTHSIPVALIAGGVTYAEVRAYDHGVPGAAIAVALTLAVILSAGLKGLLPGHPRTHRQRHVHALIRGMHRHHPAAGGITELAGAAIGAGLVSRHYAGITLLPYAVFIGMIVHIFMDSLTKDGCPWFWWPFRRTPPKMYHIPPSHLRFRTGDAVETGMRWVLIAGFIYLASIGTWATLPGHTIFGPR